MGIIHSIASVIATRSDLAGVPRPILDAVTKAAVETLFDGLDTNLFRPGMESTTLDDLAMCECGIISPECHHGEDATLCPGCLRESQKCEPSPTGKHEVKDAAESLACAHCGAEMAEPL